jgi:peptide/nickel transport system permease protein
MRRPNADKGMIALPGIAPALAGISVDTLDVRSCIEPLAEAKKTTVTTALPEADIAPSRGARSTQIASELVRRPLAIFGLAIILIIVVAAIGAPLLAPFPPDEQLFDGLTIEGAPLPPNRTFLLGTDLLGRDLLSRLLYGAQTSLLVGLVANGAAVAIGSLIGVAAGFLGGFVGSALMRFTDLMAAFPALLLAIVLAAIFRPSLWIVALVIALVNWVPLCRAVYTQTRSLAEREFIEAEVAIGAGRGRILFRHILPHLVPIMLVWGTLGISVTVLLEATLSFLGIGVQPPTPSWGNIINENQTYFITAPWLVFIPGAAILLLALAFNLVGETLRDILDPTQKGQF